MPFALKDEEAVRHLAAAQSTCHCFCMSERHDPVLGSLKEKQRSSNAVCCASR